MRGGARRPPARRLLYVERAAEGANEHGLFQLPARRPDLADPPAQAVGREGLLQQVTSKLGPLAALAERRSRVARHEQHLHLRARHLEAVGQLPAVHPGHHHVGDQQVDRAPVLPRPARRASRAVGGLEHARSRMLEDLAGQVAHGVLVLHQQHRLACRAGRAGGPEPARGRRRIRLRPAGGRCWKVVPRPRLAVDRDVPAALLDDAVDGRQAEPGALAQPPWW